MLQLLLLLLLCCAHQTEHSCCCWCCCLLGPRSITSRLLGECVKGKSNDTSRARPRDLARATPSQVKPTESSTRQLLLLLLLRCIVAACLLSRAELPGAAPPAAALLCCIGRVSLADAAVCCLPALRRIACHRQLRRARATPSQAKPKDGGSHPQTRSDLLRSDLL